MSGVEINVARQGLALGGIGQYSDGTINLKYPSNALLVLAWLAAAEDPADHRAGPARATDAVAFRAARAALDAIAERALQRADILELTAS